MNPNKVPRMGMSLASAMEGITDHPSKAMPQPLKLEDIIVDQAIQVRVNGLSEDNLQRIQAVLENGGSIDEPVIVYKTEQGLILADGFHRVEVHRRLNRPTILGIVRHGSFEDAVSFAEDANLKHGQPLTNDDKKSLLFRRLERGHDWQQTSYEQIAKALGVNRTTVSRWFQEFSTRANAQVDRSKVVGADGKARDMSASVEANQSRTYTALGRKSVPIQRSPRQEFEILVATCHSKGEINREDWDAVIKGKMTLDEAKQRQVERKAMVVEVDPHNRSQKPDYPDNGRTVAVEEVFGRTATPLPQRIVHDTVNSGDLEVAIRRKLATEAPAIQLLQTWNGSRNLQECAALDPDLRYELQGTLQDVAYGALERWAQLTQMVGYRDDGFLDAVWELLTHYNIVEGAQDERADG